MAGEKVLIIEDRRENIVYLANNILKPNGYQVLTAMDGEQGLKRAIAETPDLIIMDMNMPKRDGLEVMTALRERKLDIPVILTTFYGSEQVAQQAYRLGAVEYIVKPYGVNEMVAAVEKALAKRRSLPQRAEPAEVMPLGRQFERWMRDMNILNNVGKALVAQLELDSVLARAVEAAIYIIRADQAFLFLARPGQEADLSLRAMRGPTDRQVRLLDQLVDSELAAYAAGSDKPLLRGDAQAETALGEVAGHALGPLIATPLRWRREMIGVLLAARNPGEAAFRDTDAEWLSGLADYVAIAVRNARACQQRTAQPPQQMSVDRQRELEQLAKELQATAERLKHLTAS
jgi:CheY-like chemotaxis protein